jgi:hypothetical protein
MSKPRFANKWYQTPPVNELRQEVQAIYDSIVTEFPFKDSSGNEANIALTGGGELPFYDSAGAAKDIPLTST